MTTVLSYTPWSTITPIPTWNALAPFWNRRSHPPSVHCRQRRTTTNLFEVEKAAVQEARESLRAAMRMPLNNFVAKTASDGESQPDKTPNPTFVRLILRSRSVSSTPLETFASTGHGDVKKLKGSDREYRLRVGDWRVRFERLEAGVYRVLRVLHRREAYRQ